MGRHGSFAVRGVRVLRGLRQAGALVPAAHGTAGSRSEEDSARYACWIPQGLRTPWPCRMLCKSNASVPAPAIAVRRHCPVAAFSLPYAVGAS